MFPWVYALNTAKVDTALARIGAALMVGVDATGFAEIMLCCVGVPAVKCEVIRAFQHLDRTGDGSDGSSLTACAERTIAAADILKAKG